MNAIYRLLFYDTLIIMESLLTPTQLQGIQKISTLKDNFAFHNLLWLNDANVTISNTRLNYSNVMDTFINTFCSHEMADSDYISIHQEANQYSQGKELFADTTIEKLLKHLTYIIWTDKSVEGYFLARIKDQTIYHILDRLSSLQTSILTPAT